MNMKNGENGRISRKNTMAVKKGELEPRQKKFCREYLKDFNGKQAYIRAGYSKKGADAGAARLLVNVKVFEYLQKKVSESTKKSDISTVEMLEHFKKIAFMPATDFVEDIDMNTNKVKFRRLEDFDSSIINSIKAGQNAYGNTLEMKLVSREFALKMLANYTGKFSDKIDHTSAGEKIAPLQIVVESEAEAKRLGNVLGKFGGADEKNENV